MQKITFSLYGQPLGLAIIPIFLWINGGEGNCKPIISNVMLQCNNLPALTSLTQTSPVNDKISISCSMLTNKLMSTPGMGAGQLMAHGQVCFKDLALV